MEIIILKSISVVLNLAKGFVNTSTLECLNLYNNKAAAEGMKVLAQSLKGHLI